MVAKKMLLIVVLMLFMNMVVGVDDCIENTLQLNADDQCNCGGVQQCVKKSQYCYLESCNDIPQCAMNEITQLENGCNCGTKKTQCFKGNTCISGDNGAGHCEVEKPKDEQHHENQASKYVTTVTATVTATEDIDLEQARQAMATLVNKDVSAVEVTVPEVRRRMATDYGVVFTITSDSEDEAATVKAFVDGANFGAALADAMPNTSAVSIQSSEIAILGASPCPLIADEAECDTELECYWDNGAEDVAPGCHATLSELVHETDRNIDDTIVKVADTNDAAVGLGEEAATVERGIERVEQNMQNLGEKIGIVCSDRASQANCDAEEDCAWENDACVESGSSSDIDVRKLDEVEKEQTLTRRRRD